MSTEDQRRGFLAQGWGHFLIVLLAVLTFLLYLFGGVFQVIRSESEYHMCTFWRFGFFDGHDLPRFVRLDDSLIPPRAVCRWEDGYTLDHVPSFVTPSLAVLIVMLVAMCVIVIVHNRRESLRLRR